MQDTEWKYDYIDHDRNIARAFVYDENGYFYFVRANRDDDFGKATLIETAGGGVEDGTNKFVPSERAREGFALISEMKGYGKSPHLRCRTHYHLSHGCGSNVTLKIPT